MCSLGDIAPRRHTGRFSNQLYVPLKRDISITRASKKATIKGLRSAGPSGGGALDTLAGGPELQVATSYSFKDETALLGPLLSVRI